MFRERSIRCFMSLAETLSFTESAKQLGVSQQSVSKTISELETELGIPLFTRTHHYVYLTHAGTRFYHLFGRFQRDLDAAIAESVSEIAQERTLRVGLLDGLNLFPVFDRMNKETTLQLTLAQFCQLELASRFKAHKLDFMITFDEDQQYFSEESGVEKAFLMDIPLVLLAPGNRADPSGDFQTFIAVTLGEETELQSTGRELARCRSLGFHPSGILVCPNPASAYLAVSLGRGVMISTAWSAGSANPQVRAYPIGRNQTLACFYPQSVTRMEAQGFVAAFRRFADPSPKNPSAPARRLG